MGLSQAELQILMDMKSEITVIQTNYTHLPDKEDFTDFKIEFQIFKTRVTTVVSVFVFLSGFMQYILNQ